MAIIVQRPTSTSRVVIVGGGVIGCMTAYYLTRAGVSDVVVV
ncbi:MAG: FAD-dependent oxidoreductase, partial [Chloroflexi bacterium]|nr:FAD-dependent oxidoreductase [Chloroflexota bacterium]